MEKEQGDTREATRAQGGRWGSPASRPTIVVGRVGLGTNHRLSPFAGSFLQPPLRRFEVPGVLQTGRETPLGSPYKYEGGVNEDKHKQALFSIFSLE